MSHTTIYFLAEAEGIEEAQSKVDSYLETEHFFDYYTFLPESSTGVHQGLGLEKCRR